MDRRAFLKLLGLGAGATAAGLVLPEVEPVRRWYVGRNAPVQSRGDIGITADLVEDYTESDKIAAGYGLERMPGESDDDLLSRVRESFYRPAFASVDRTADGRFIAVGDRGELQTSRDGIVWTERNPIMIGTKHPNALRLETGDDVRRAYGSSFEDVARQVDAERQRPVKVYDVNDLRVSIGGRELRVNPSARLRIG